jgi:phosphate transport system permease protein
MSVQAQPNPFAARTARARRRKIVGYVMEGVATAAAILAVVVLAIVIGSVAKRGLPAIDLDFFTQNAAPFGQSGGGIANAIVGTVILIAIATAMAVPAGLLLAIFNTEFAPPRVANAIRLTLNVLAGVPTIVIGVFIFSLVVVGRGQSAFAAAMGLAIVMLPLIARATEEVLLLVPSSLREGSLALGASRSRTVLTVILPTAVGGMVTATIVAAARAAGETAPLLFTAAATFKTSFSLSGFMNSLPVQIYNDVTSPTTAVVNRAWGAALALVSMILLLNLFARLVSRRSSIG